MSEEMIKTAPIALFCYNREDLLRRTVDALQGNELASESDLFIFSDGPRGEKDFLGVQQVRSYLTTIQGFKSVTIRESAVNKGLARSVIAGISEIIEQYGCIIVVEDDLVTAPHFLRYMNDALRCYADCSAVGSIAGFSPISGDGLQDTFFLSGSHCWGWGTWRRAWQLFQPDVATLLKGFDSPEKIHKFNFDGAHPYYEMLNAQARGEVDSWAIRWFASLFLNHKLTLYPRRNLISNIGFYSGTHFAKDSGMKINSLEDFLPTVLPMEPVENHAAFLQYQTYYLNLYRDPNPFRRVLKKAFKMLCPFGLLWLYFRYAQNEEISLKHTKR